MNIFILILIGWLLCGLIGIIICQLSDPFDLKKMTYGDLFLILFIVCCGVIMLIFSFTFWWRQKDMNEKFWNKPIFKNKDKNKPSINNKSLAEF